MQFSSNKKSRSYKHLVKSFFILLMMTTVPQAHAKFGCQLDKGYELPEDVNLSWFCTFNNEIASAEQLSTNKYGAVNRKGAVVIPFEYDSSVEFWQGRALVQKADKWVIIDTDNQQVAEFNFQEAGSFGPTGLANFKKAGKWGFIDTKGKIIVQPQFDNIVTNFGYPLLNENVVAIFEVNDKLGAINPAGKIIIPAQFDEIYQANDILFVISNDKVGIYDYKGNMVQPVEFEFETFNGFYSDEYWTDENWLPLTKNGKVGAIDKRGNLIVPVEFDSVDIIGKSTFAVSKAGKYGIYGTNNLLIPLQFDYIADSLEGPTRVKKEGKWGYLKDFNSLMLVDYDEADDFFEGLASVGNHQQQGESTLWGYINTIGEEVIPLHYQEIRAFNDGLAAVKSDGKWGVIDFQENQIVPFEYDAISSFKDGYAIVAMTNPDNADSSIVPDQISDDVIEYSLSDDTDDELYIDNFDSRDNAKMKFGIIDQQGNIVLPLGYDNVTHVFEGVIGVKNNDKWGFVSQQGQPVIFYQFDQIFPPFKEGTIQVSYCYDDNENTIPCWSDEVTIHTLHIDKQGNVLEELWSSNGVAEDEVEVEEATD